MDAGSGRAFASLKVMCIHGNHSILIWSMDHGWYLDPHLYSWIFMVNVGKLSHSHWIFSMVYSSIWCTPRVFFNLQKLGNRTHLRWLDTSSPSKSHKVGGYMESRVWWWKSQQKTTWPPTLPETNSSHLKMDGWNTIVSFWDGLFSGASC